MTPPERSTPPISRRGGAAKRRPRQRGPGNRVVCSRITTLTIGASVCLPLPRTRRDRSCLSPVQAVGAAPPSGRSGLCPAQLVGDHRSVETLELQWFLDDGGPPRQLLVDVGCSEDLPRCG